MSWGWIMGLGILCILADEPTANLDSKIGHEIARLLKRAAEEGGSLLIVSRDQRLRDIADRILWLEDGESRAMSDMASDPVCGTAVEREGALHLVRDGEAFFFCSSPCRDEFSGDAGRLSSTHMEVKA
jgi:putative ABC transport system ATP-binding protein